MGNRFRAISSAMVLAKQTGRKIYHAWTPIIPNDKRPMVRPLQAVGFEGFFLPTDFLPPASEKNIPAIDICFTEWLPNDYWYAFQSNAQSAWKNISRTEKISNAADNVACSDADVILIETSHALQLSHVFGGCDGAEDWEKELGLAYAMLRPLPKFMELIEKIEKSEVGIAIRRGDLLHFFPEANQNLEELKKWVSNLSKEKTIMVFSDDAAVRDDIMNLILSSELIKSRNNSFIKDLIYKNIVKDLHQWESAFIQFLYLSLRCKIIYGTPASSFAKEASLFGRIPFFHNLSHKIN